MNNMKRKNDFVAWLDVTVQFRNITSHLHQNCSGSVMFAAGLRQRDLESPYRVPRSHVVPGDIRWDVGRLHGVLQVRAVQRVPLLQRDDGLGGLHGHRWRAVDSAGHLVQSQHLQAHGDLTAGRLVAKRRRGDAGGLNRKQTKPSKEDLENLPV